MTRFEKVKRITERIKLPKRSTENSAGYDFESLYTVPIPSIWSLALRAIANKFSTGANNYIKPTLVETGIKASFEKDEVLKLYNRSSNPFKKGLILANGVGIIDSDYYNNPDNDGEIMFAFYNFLPWDVTIEAGEKIGQGVFSKFLLVDDDTADGERQGGFGSTDK